MFKVHDVRLLRDFYIKHVKHNTLAVSKAHSPTLVIILILCNSMRGVAEGVKNSPKIKMF